ncbi:hypothetical protein ACLKA7_007388 [Drosophila subpalustris]
MCSGTFRRLRRKSPAQQTPKPQGKTNAAAWRSKCGDKVTLNCSFCHSSRVFRGNIRNTGNLHRHIRTCHPHLTYKLEEMKVARQIELAAARKLRKKILRSLRNGSVVPTIPTNIIDVDNDEMEESSSDVDAAAEKCIFTPYPYDDHTYSKRTQ